MLLMQSANESIHKMFMEHDERAAFIFFWNELIKSIKAKNKIIDGKVKIILLNRKMYNMYSLLKAELDEIPEECISNNQYYYNTMEYDSLKGKDVYIVDDTMNTGRAIRTFYEFLLERGIDTTPVVFLKNTNYISDNSPFDDKLVFFCDATPEMIGKMCMHETISFHDDLLPNIANLPIINLQNKSNVATRKIVLTKEEFERLTTNTEEWTYIQNDYDIIPGIKDTSTSVKSAFFKLSCDYLIDHFNGFVASLIVKCHYKEKENGLFELVLVPFAVLRSCTQYELLNCFFCLFEGNGYEEKVRNSLLNCTKIDTEKSIDMVYRSILYNLSIYTGVKFIRHLVKCDIDGVFSFTHNNVYSDDLIKEIERIFDATENYAYFDEVGYLKRIFKMDIHRSSLDESLIKKDIVGMEKDADQNEAYGLIYKKVIDTKRKISNADALTFEELENYLYRNIKFENQNRAHDTFISIMLKMLDMSLLSNYIMTDSTGKVCRCFRYGENSDLILPYDFKLFYRGLYSYWKRSEDEFCKGLVDFLYSFKSFLIENDFIPLLMSEKNYNFFSEYFRNIPEEELKTQMENKVYIFDYNDYVDDTGFTDEAVYSIKKFADTVII